MKWNGRGRQGGAGHALARHVFRMGYVAVSMYEKM